MLQVHEVEDWGQLQLLAELSDYAVYVSLNAKNQLRAPTEFGLCLRPNRVRAHSAPSTPPTPGAADNTEGLLCLACESERIRTCWATAMRLAKVTPPFTISPTLPAYQKTSFVTLHFELIETNF